MPTVQMPTGELVEMPDNPTPAQLAELELITSPSGAGGGLPFADRPNTPWYQKRIPGTNMAIASEHGILADLERGTKLALRPLVQGVTGSVGLVSDLPYHLANAFGANVKVPGAERQRYIDKHLGVPETTLEKGLEIGGTLAAGALLDPGMASLSKLVGPPVPPPTHPLAEKATTIREAQKQGYTMTPNQANAAAGSRALESVVGKTHLQQMAAVKNQNVTNTIATREAGLPNGTPLTTEALQKAIKATYAHGYGPIEDIPVVTNGSVYRRALDRALEEFQGMSKSFPDAAKPEVAKLINSYRVKQFSGADAVRATQTLRDDATAAFARGEGQLAKANLAIARAIEDSVELNLSHAGRDAKDILDGFRAARTQMAKQYAVKDSIIEGSGAVDAHKLARQLAHGAPLTGDLRTAAKFANTSPLLTAYPKNPPGLFTTPESYMLGSAAPAGFLSGNLPSAAGLAGIPAVRAATRMGMLTAPYQRAFVHPNVDPTLLQKLQQHPSIMRAMPAALGSGLYGQ